MKKRKVQKRGVEESKKKKRNEKEKRREEKSKKKEYISRLLASPNYEKQNPSRKAPAT